MQSEPSSKHLGNLSSFLSLHTQLEYIRESKSQSLNKHRELIDTHQRGSHGLRGLGLEGNLSLGFS